MFEKRRISLKKLAAKQTRPVQPVAPRPEVKSPLSSPSEHITMIIIWKYQCLLKIISPFPPWHLDLQRKERRYSADSAICKKVWLRICFHLFNIIHLLVFDKYTEQEYDCLWVQLDSPIHNGGTRHASLSEEDENLAVLRRWVSQTRNQCHRCVQTLLSLQKPDWRSICIPSSHVMNELLETERAYVEELLCVLEVSGHCVSHSTFLHRN